MNLCSPSWRMTPSRMLGMQTEAAQLNKANALLVFNAKQAMDQNRLLTNLAEMNLLRLKQERDAQVHSA